MGTDPEGAVPSMQFSQDEVKLIAGFILDDYEHERLTTLRVLESMPVGKEDYTPDAKSMSAIRLAFHLVASEWFLLKAVLRGTPPAVPFEMPDSIHTAQDVIAWANAKLPERVEQVKLLSGEALSRQIVFEKNRKISGYEVLQLMTKHSIHHRGQLCAYLRPMGAPVPAIYGSSGDSN